VKRILVALCLLLAPFCSAQQPDIRLQVLSLYKVQKATIYPLDGAKLRWCARCDAAPLKSALRISTLASLVKNDDDGKSSAGLWLDGRVRVEFDGAQPRTFRIPLEVHAMGGALIFIARLPTEEYTAAVVQGETSGNMPPEALRAIAVAARTYATHFRERHKVEHFDFCDSTHCQFANLNVTPAVTAAVEQTRGELLWDHGKPLAAYYHQDCGGRTESAKNVWPSAEQANSSSRDDPYCVRSSKPWRAEISHRELGAAMKSAGLRVPQQWDEIRILRRTPSGRAQTLTFGNEHSENDVPVAASSLRFAVGRSMGWSFLKSDLYDVASNGDHFVFTGRGTGHGVGLCQFGAAEMAREGKSYRDILAFYYPGASIGVAASGIVWRKSPSARLDVFTVDGEPRSALQSGVRALTWAESQTRLHSTIRPAIYVYPSVEMFRNATGEPGWVAASTRDQTIRMQPAKVLGAKMESILRHEFVHVLLENHAAPQTPLWFREGLAMLMTGDVPTSATPLGVRQMEETLRTRSDNKSIQAAYASALTLTARLEQRYGRDEILRWLTNGIPSGIVEGQSRLQETAHHR